MPSTPELRSIMQISEDTEVRDVMEDARSCGVVLGVNDGRLVFQRKNPPPSMAAIIRSNLPAITSAVTLERRLATGEMKIRRYEQQAEAAEKRGDQSAFQAAQSEVARLTDYWCQLIEQYEQACLVKVVISEDITRPAWEDF